MEFKPGTYQKGDIVTVNGVQYVADRDILFASAIPKENMYWSKVEAEPIPTTGLSPKNTPEQNSIAWETLINSLPEGSTKNIHVPAGNYHFARYLPIFGRPIKLTGDNGTIWGNGTRFYFPKESQGLMILRNGGYQETIIENITLIGAGNQNEWMDGIVIRGRVTLRGVYVKGFYNGIEFACNISEGNDCSGSYIEKCFAAENTNNGFHMQGEDANAMTFIGCDSRDNGKYGFYDASFLGNYFISCMCHDNKGGHYYVRDKNNARSTFIACYGESGSPVNSFSLRTTVSGGFLANGYTLDGTNIIYQ